jgi:hypothetical protein
MRRRVRDSPTPVEVEQFLSGANGCHCVGALVDQLRSKTKIERISQQAREARLCVAKKNSEQRALLRNLFDLSVRQVADESVPNQGKASVGVGRIERRSREHLLPARTVAEIERSDRTDDPPASPLQ